MDLSKSEYRPEHPPVHRWMAVLLAFLLLVQLRNDQPVDSARGMKLVHEVYQHISNRFPNPPSEKELWEGAVDGMLARLNDPYSHYIPPEQAKWDKDELVDKEKGGIGVTISEQPGEGLAISLVMQDMPAQKAGIREGDVIIRIDGKAIGGMSFFGMMKAISGEVGEKVTVTVRRDGKTFDRTMERVSLPKVCLFPPTMLRGHPAIGYIGINFFTDALPEELVRNISEFKEKGMQGLVLDLRWSPGGSLHSGVGAANLFVDKGVVTIVEIPKSSYEKHSVQMATPGKYNHFPIAILVGSNTASAAELFSAALRDNGRAVLVGQKTFGKAKIQLVIPIKDSLSRLNLTVGKYLTPKGEDIDKVGLTPDYVVKVDEEKLHNIARNCNKVWFGGGGVDILLKNDPQFKKAVEVLRQKIDEMGSKDK